MASYGITLIQLAKFTAIISAERNEEFTAINQVGFYKRFCAAQDFDELIREDITINNIEAIDYSEWKMRFYEVQRSSTPLFGSREPQILTGKEKALLILLGQGLLEENVSINMNKSIEAIDYSEWEIIIQEAQRSSTPLFGSQDSELLVVTYEKEDAALFMLMGHRIMEPKY